MTNFMVKFVAWVAVLNVLFWLARWAMILWVIA